MGSVDSRARRNSFVRRLVKLDGETYERSADIGARGDPAGGGFVMQRVNKKQCRCCLKPAQFSLAFVISTIGVSPRRQKCSSILLLCENCIRELCERLAPTSIALCDALRNAYTTLNCDCPDTREQKET